MDNKLRIPKIIPTHIDCESWDVWLEKTEKSLKEIGYRKYRQNLQYEDFAYWKKISINDKEVYQIGILFYDFRKYTKEFNDSFDRIGVQFECMFINVDARIDLSVSKDITLEEFEIMSNSFYHTMKQYCKSYPD